MTDLNPICCDYLTYLRAAGQPETTVKLRWYQLRRLSRAFPDVLEVSTSDLARWLTGQGWSLETMRSHRSAVVRFYRWCADSELIQHSPADALPTVKTAQHTARPAPEYAITEALQRGDSRQRLMIELAARHGLRRAEIAKVHGHDLVRDLAGWSLTVHGKGGKIRLVPISAWLAGQIRRAGDGYLFPGNDHGHLSPAYVGKLISRLLPAGWSTHTLRHRFATRVYSGSHDLMVVQQLLGHSKIETTRGYVAIPADAVRNAMQYAA